MLKLEKEKSNSEEDEGSVRYEEEKALKSNILKMYLYQIFIGCHMISGVLLPFYLTWGKLLFIEVMFLQSYFTVMILIFEIPCGAISDYISRRLSLILGAAITALSCLVYGSVPTFSIFLVGETLFALGFSLISGTDQAIVYITLKKLGREKETSKILARMKSCFILGITISAPIGSLIGSVLPLNFVFIFMSAPFIIATIIGLSFHESENGLDENKGSYLEIIKSGINEIKNNKILRNLTLDLVIFEGIIFFIVWTYQMYLEILGISLMFFGFITAMMTITEMIFTNLAPKLQEKTKKPGRFLLIYTLIPGVAFILMAFTQNMILGILLILITSGIGISRSILFVSAINHKIEGKNRSTILSTVSMIGNLIRAILYPIVGLLVMNNFKITFIVLGASILLISLISGIINNI